MANLCPNCKLSMDGRWHAWDGRFGVFCSQCDSYQEIGNTNGPPDTSLEAAIGMEAPCQ